MRLSDRVCIVTGAGRGIGEAVASAFAREGARLAIASRTDPELQRVAKALVTSGAQVLAVPTDVSDSRQVHTLVDRAVQEYGRVDVLVNAAGVYGPIGPVWRSSTDEWARAIAINLIGTFMSCHAVLPHMIEQKWGRIINFSGGGATSPLPHFSAYGASKVGVVRLTETLAEELREHNVRVNVIAPGAVDTRLQDDVLAAGEDAGPIFERIKRLRETGEGGVPPALPAELAVFLASEDSGGLTGKLISAPHDAWRSWGPQDLEQLTQTPWLTLRRLDRHTISGLGEPVG